MSPQLRIGLRTLAIGATMALALVAVDVLERGFDAISVLLRVGVVALLAVLWGAAGGYSEGFVAGRKAEKDLARRRAEEAQAREHLERLGDLKNPAPEVLAREIDPHRGG
jgi:hypothetical protein